MYYWICDTCHLAYEADQFLSLLFRPADCLGAIEVCPECPYGTVTLEHAEPLRPEPECLAAVYAFPPVKVPA